MPAGSRVPRRRGRGCHAGGVARRACAQFVGGRSCLRGTVCCGDDLPGASYRRHPLTAMPESNPLSTTRRADRPRAHRGTSETEIAIFAAAERLLAKEPLHDLSVAQIITEAGISRATFYFYFSSKFAVVVGLLAQVMDEIFEVVQPFVNRSDEVAPAIALQESLAAAVALWARHRPALRAIHEHWNTTDELRELWVGVVNRFTDALAGEIERERKAGLARSVADSRAIAATLLWGTERLLYVAGLGVDPNFSDESETLEPLMAVWTGTLYGGVPAPTGKPARRRPAASKPAAGKPAAGKPALGKPAAGKPAATKPAVGKRAPRKR
jgi:TetR/AcrR family transcriptional regulator, ethionamide resistance regulator